MKWVKLGEIAEISSGGTPRRSNNSYWKDGNIPWIKISDLKSKYVSSSEEFITESGLNNSSAKLFNEGTILYTIFATIGEVSILKISATSNQAIAGINVLNDSFNVDYVYYYLLSIKDKMKKKSRGVAQNNINLTILKKLEVPFIKIEKQNKIVNLLKETENLINIRKEQIQAYDDFIESLFYEMFGDPNGKSNGFKLKKLGELGRWNSGGTPKRSNKNYFTGDIPWVTSGELNDIFIHDSFEHINEEAIENSSAKLVPIGSLLLGMYDSAGLKSSISSKVLTTNQAIAFSKLDDDICNTIFVYFCIQLMRDKLLKKQRGVRQKNFNLSMIKEISIPIPPIELQNKFADYVIKIEGEKKKSRESLDELEILFEALMQDAFSGNLLKE